MKIPLPRALVGLIVSLPIAFSSLPVVAAEKIADQAHARHELEGLTEKPKFINPGPAFDARKAMAGKSILTIPCAPNLTFGAHIISGMKDASEAVEYPISVWVNRAKMSEYRQGLANAIATKPSLVDLLACPDPKDLKPEIEAVKAAGIPVVASHQYGVGIKVPNVTYSVPNDYGRAGRLMADWIITKDPHAHVLVLVSGELSSSRVLQRGITAEFGRYGGSDIHYVIKDLSAISDWATKIPPAVRAAVASDPKLTYIIGIYDYMAADIAKTLAEVHAENRVHILGFNGWPTAIDLVREGKVEMVIGEGLVWAGYAIADAEMRILAGQRAVKSLALPYRIFTRENAAEAGVPADYDKGFGDDYKGKFLKVWQVPQAAVAH